MKKIIGILVVFLCLLPGMVLAGEDYVLGVSLYVITSTTGVSAVGTPPANTNHAIVGVGGPESGSSAWWLPSTDMTGVGTDVRGIAIPNDKSVFRIDGYNAVSKSRFSTCSLGAVTVFVVYMGKP